MLLEKISIKNWRCFYGEQHIEFASRSDRNVTLIHAENGVGKTSLLNALLWCFYNKHTARFEKPNDIINHQAAREGEQFAHVAVEFSHEDNLYEARRTFRKNSETNNDSLRVTKISDDGTQEQVRNDPNLFLNSVLPADMAAHFLFDGEHAEALTGRTNSNVVSKAIKDILGCSFVVQTIEALEPIEASYRRAMSSPNTLSKVNQLEDELARQQKSVQKLIKSLEQIDTIIPEMEDNRNSIENSLSQFSNIKQAQLTKKNLITLIEREEKNRKKSISQQQAWINENSFYLLGDCVANNAKNILIENEEKLASKTKFNKEIIDQILSLGECVCGVDLSDNEGIRQHLISQLDTAESLELKQRIKKVENLISRIKKNDAVNAINKFNLSMSDQVEHEKLISDSEISLSEVSRAIENSDLENISKLQKESSALYNDILDKKRQQGEESLKLRAAQAKLQKLQAELNQLASSSKDDRKLEKHLMLTRKVKEYLSDRLEDDLDAARKVINIYVKEIIDRTARKDFKVVVDKNFTVLLKDKFGQDMAKSEGENQLLGLAFTGALAKFAKMRKNASGKVLLPGTEAPLVLDAPFGKLDSVYKHATAEFLPEMASQVIVMVNKEQGSERVLEILNDRIGYQYALVRHNTSAQGEKSSENLITNSKTICITHFNSVFDGTVIEAI